jgi:hypothetical protein
MLINEARFAMLIAWNSRDVMSSDLMIPLEVGVTIHLVIQSPPADFVINILLSDLWDI